MRNMKLWAQNGKLVRTAAGKLLVCATCPCADPEEVCRINCMAAIRERQSATNRTRWADDAVKTLPEAKTEVNWIAQQFIHNDYTGGADLPTLYSSSYANPANTWCDLYALIIVLTHTKRTYGGALFGGGSTIMRWGQATRTDFATLGAAIASALANEYTQMQNAPGAYWNTIRSAAGYDARESHGAFKAHLSSMTALVSKVANIYSRFAKVVVIPPKTSVFDNQGWSAVTTENHYVMIDGFTCGTATDVYGAEVGFPNPPENYDDPGGIGGNVTKGLASSTIFAILIWSFVHHE